MDEFLNYLLNYAVFNIAVICFGIGYVIKHYISIIPNKYIPLILGLCGIILNIAFNNWHVSFQIILIGLGSGVAATGSFEAVRELVGKKDVNSNNNSIN